MSRIAYVNGRYVPMGQARVSIEDRGYQFADGIYEVIEVQGGALIDETLHVDRLAYSLGEIRIATPLSRTALGLIVREVVTRNRVRDGMVYIQITRGVTSRDHPFPEPPVRPAIVITAKSVDRSAQNAKAEKGIRVITLPDIRWKRPDIKSISLLPNVLAKEDARSKGAAEAWLVGEDGLIKEGAASNAWIVASGRRVVTHPVDRRILKGVTRSTLLKLLDELDLTFEERPFSSKEAYCAEEAFITGATSLVMPVVAIDGNAIGKGTPGPTVLELRRRFHTAAERSPI